MIVVATMLVGVSASNAWPLEARLVHAVPGAGSAKLSVGDSSTAPVGFGGVSSEVKAPDGKVTLRLLGTADNQTLASTTKTLNGGRYTVVATKSGENVRLLVFRDQGAKKRLAGLRVIHAAPELGNVDVEADGKPVAKGLAFEDA